MTPSLVRGREIEPYLPAMTALAEGDATSHPLSQHPLWIAHEIRRRASQDVAVALVHESSRLVGYGALVVVANRMTTEVKGVSIPLLTGNSWCLLGGSLVCARDRSSLVEQQLIDAMTRGLGRSIIKLEETLETSPVPTAFSLHPRAGWRLHASPSSGQKTWFVDVDSPWSAYLDHFSAKRRSALKRQSRKLREKFSDLAMVKITDPSDVPDYLAKFDALYRTTWHFEEQPHEWNAEPLRQVHAELAARGMIRSYLFTSAGKALAVAHGTVYQGQFVLENLAYEERYADLSPGTALLFEAVEDLFTVDPPRVISFGFGNNQYKDVLARRSVAANTFYVERTAVNAARFVPLALYRRLHALIMRRRQTAAAARPVDRSVSLHP